MVGGTSPGKGGSDASRPSGLRHRRGVPRERTGRRRLGRSTCRRPALPTRSCRGNRRPGSRSSSASPRASRYGDMVQGASARSTGSSSRLIGPNCPGVVTAGECEDRHHAGRTSSSPARSAIVSRSGTLTYEAVFQTTSRGPRPDHGGGHRRAIPSREPSSPMSSSYSSKDDKTTSIVMIGEIGGSAEEEAAQFLRDEAKRGRRKPMVGFIAGRTAPPGPQDGARRRHHLRWQGRRRETRSQPWRRPASRSLPPRPASEKPWWRC